MINYHQPIILLARALQTQINTVTYGAHTGRVKDGYLENCKSISEWFHRKVKPSLPPKSRKYGKHKFCYINHSCVQICGQ